MKRSKILISTLPALAVTPAIVLSSCGQSASDSIIDAIIAPTKLTKATPVGDFMKSFRSLSDESWQKEIIYDLFGVFNTNGDQVIQFDEPLTKMWENKVVSFKTNITKCSREYSNEKFHSTFLGYVSFVFNQEVKAKIHRLNEITFKANDFVMLTYDFFNADIEIKDNGSLEYVPKMPETSIMGIYKIKYDDGKEELMARAPNPDTSNWTVKNSNNWVKK